MNSKRTYYLMLAVLSLLVLAILGGTYVSIGMLKKQSTKLVDYKLQDQVLQQEQTGLIKAKADVKKYSELEKIAKVIVPQDKDQAKAVREIIKIAAESGIKPTAINFPVSTLGNGAKGAAGASGVAGTSAATAAPGSGAGGAKALSQLSPVKGIPGVYNLPITIEVDSTSLVPYDKFIEFLRRLEQNRRTAQVTSIVLQPSATNRNLVSFTLTLDEFIKP